jgi:hypothetical protein
MYSEPIKSFVYEVPGRGEIIFHELADGTFHATGTARIYTREQYEAGVEKLMAIGGKLLRSESR